MAELDLNMLSTSDLGYTVDDEDDDDPVLLDQDGNPVETWRERYPYDERLPRGQYEREKRLLQIQLLKLQRWTKRTGARHVILFEGRDAAGKGGTIKRFMQHLNPAVRGSWHWRNLPRPNKDSGICSATSRTCRAAARWCCSTGPGATAQGSRR
jgi:polyphosphate kinase 2 (PPK2 family)